MAQLGVCGVAVVVIVLQGLTITPAAADSAFGGEVILIRSVTVGTPFLGGQSTCQQYADKETTVLPVTIVATIISPPGDEPVGPYATAGWNGGLGGYDDHFGSAGGHNPTQVFHIQMTSGLGYDPPGQYFATVQVQDPSVEEGYVEKDNIPFTLQAVPPSRLATSKVKCALGGDASGGALDLLKSMVVDQALEYLECTPCNIAKKVWDVVNKYEDGAYDSLASIVKHDPPDNDYQQLATATPLPLLPLPGGLTADQQMAALNLENAFADVDGTLNALLTTLDRVWGADNAGSVFWYNQQAQQAAALAAQASSGVAGLPGLFSALKSALAPGIPSFGASALDALNFQNTLAQGLPADQSSALTELGMSQSDQLQLDQMLLGVDASTLATTDGADALIPPASDLTALASDLQQFSTQASLGTQAAPPEIAGVFPDSGPDYGGTQVTVVGSNLDTVTGVNFGPSSPAAGQATDFGCGDQQCLITAPPGQGTVDVTLIGPGGPSALTPADQYTYVPSPTPVITHVFPPTGSTAGGDSVTIEGSGLGNASIYFGPSLVQSYAYNCSATECTVTTPPSGSPDTVDVTAVSSTGSSPISAADHFTYVPSPPPPAAPVVTGVSPSQGSYAGGETVTISGSNFTNATLVEIDEAHGDCAPSFVVDDDSHISFTSPGASDCTGTAGTFDVTVLGPGGTSAVTAADQFTFLPEVSPEVTGLSVQSGPETGGTSVTITGTNLPNTNGEVVMFGQYFSADVSCSFTECTAVAPPQPVGTVDVTVDNSPKNSADKFTYTAAPLPVVTSVAPAVGTTAGGTDVIVQGKHLANAFGPAYGPVPAQASFGGDPANGYCSPTSCVLSAPAHVAGSVNVIITTQAGTSAITTADTFIYLNPGQPAVESVDPDSQEAERGDAYVTITGQNLTGGSVDFGSTNAEFMTCTQTSCTGYAPSGLPAGTVDVTVTTASGTSAVNPGDQFTDYVPAVTGVFPSTGWTLGGTQVTVTGNHLTDMTVYFGATTATDISCSSDTECTGTAPAAASAGAVDVTVGDGWVRSATGAADQFDYQVLGPPTVTGVSPSTGVDLGGDPVTITGTNLEGGSVSFGNNLASGSPCTESSCNVSTPETASDGVVDVTVTTAAGTSATTPADQFTYEAQGTPTVTTVLPDVGSAAGGTLVTVSGTGLTDADVSFGSAVSQDVTCTATSCQAVAPAQDPGPVDVTVTNTAGTSAITPSDQFTYQLPPSPTVGGVAADYGPVTGGTAVTITGTGFTGAATVAFGSNPAASFVVASDSEIDAVAPPGSVGTVDITVETLGGTSATGTADRFVYSPVSITEVPIPGLSAASGGGQIASGVGGHIWFTAYAAGKVGRVNTDGSVTTWTTPTSNGEPGESPKAPTAGCGTPRRVPTEWSRSTAPGTRPSTRSRARPMTCVA